MRNKFNKFKYVVMNWILVRVLTYMSKDSNIVKHGIDELNLAGYNKGDGMNQLMKKQVVQLLQLFSTHGHSGHSAPFAINLFKRLANWEIIAPLTLKDDEWVANDLEKTSYQNKRAGCVFKDETGVYNIEAFVKSITHSKYFGSAKIVKSSKGSWSGTIFESRNGIATGRGFRKCFFKDTDIEKGVYLKSTIYIPCIEVEVQPEDWLMFVGHNNSELKELRANYDIHWFTVESLKGQSILSIDHNHGY